MPRPASHAAEAVGILTVNCSLFYPVPSPVSMIVSKYKLSGDVRSMELSGMGCSAGRADRCRAGGVHIRRPSRSSTTYRAPAELTILDYLITRSHKENKPGWATDIVEKTSPKQNL
ncbi:hypothetical protein QYE76_046842 [Lolium multiflorum]|uniref:FAE domain-containing protein n=1 Tax=Lolium multiflorum TaxID=4521 RepID=A0AAD8TQM4_LOLMU|nr:hypothetical protein QYE76_046842 [Lolium multiflorum]